MPTHDTPKAAPRGPVGAFLADESGAVMTEFVIVLPVLMYLFLANLLITDVNRFSLSRYGLTVVDTWRKVANAQPGGGMSSSTQIPTSSGGTAFDADSNMKPIDSKSMVPFGGSKNPFEILEISPDTYYREPFSPNKLGLPENDMIYRNQFYINPVNAAISTMVGKAPAGQAGQFDDIKISEIEQYSRLPILFDTYSPSWNRAQQVSQGQPGIQRLRNVDRYTLLGNDLDFAALATGTLIAGNRDVVDQSAQLTEDADHIGVVGPILTAISAGAYVLGAVASARGCVGALLGSDPNVTAMWKVDKSAYNHQHDTDGTMPYDQPLTERHRLEEISGGQAWEMVQ